MKIEIKKLLKKGRFAFRKEGEQISKGKKKRLQKKKIFDFRKGEVRRQKRVEKDKERKSSQYRDVIVEDLNKPE